MRALACVFLIACGGGDGEIVGEPLIQSTLMAEFGNKPWTPVFGFSRVENGNFRAYLGSDPIECKDTFSGTPRNGTYAAFGMTGEPMMGTFNSVTVNFVEVIDKQPDPQIAIGTVMLTAVTATEVSAVVGFDISSNGERYALNGAVTMIRCP